eukprot:gb/GECH01013863.1/.p1 GENE.gb/GECH01013863.1/~~gb/GECH01013863.1/.p1  ORF type:complete len:197 (+),score=46.89 gb/GECH01013863.1/:1-591(+)
MGDVSTAPSPSTFENHFPSGFWAQQASKLPPPRDNGQTIPSHIWKPKKKGYVPPSKKYKALPDISSTSNNGSFSSQIKRKKKKMKLPHEKPEPINNFESSKPEIPEAVKLNDQVNGRKKNKLDPIDTNKLSNSNRNLAKSFEGNINEQLTEGSIPTSATVTSSVDVSLLPKPSRKNYRTKNFKLKKLEPIDNNKDT